MPSPWRTSASSTRLPALAAGHGVAVCGAVLLAAESESSTVVAIALSIASVAVALLTARAGAALVRRVAMVPVGVVSAVIACLLLAVTPRGVITVLIAAVLGAGVGVTLPAMAIDAFGSNRRDVTFGVAAGAVEITVFALIGGRLAGLWAAAVIVFAVGILTIATRPARGSAAGRTLGRDGVAFVTVTAVLAVGLVAWVGANDPTVQWFGRVITHGDRSQNKVALTFDDGPDDPYTMDVSRILDDHGIKGTFFEVGKAVVARPDISRALLADGQLVGNHSFHHDYWRWLDPRYPELDRTQHAIEQALGKCPAFFRPPHGQRTPFMLAQVRNDGMHAVTWDVSAGDWASHDGRLVAQRIVDGAKPGSIILLHDGLDGNVSADRSVLLTALPLIIDGLRAKGLQPVRLDELLGVPGYLDSC
jgi:peptidoglycan/xylan/chitin deacetylase (PgdA/CDA1 family)